MVSSILPKNERKQFDLRYHSSKVEFFRWFLGELKVPKRHFEINWPLQTQQGSFTGINFLFRQNATRVSVLTFVLAFKFQDTSGEMLFFILHFFFVDISFLDLLCPNSYQTYVDFLYAHDKIFFYEWTLIFKGVFFQKVRFVFQISKSPK